MYQPHPGVMQGATTEERVRIVGELSELLTDVSISIGDAFEGMHRLERRINRILFGEGKSPLERVEIGTDDFLLD